MEKRYGQASDYMDDGDYEKARTIFLSLGDYEDSASKAQKCKNVLDYNAATALYKSGDYEAAKTAFTALGSYSDAKDMVKDCQNNIDYNKAVDLMDSGDLDGAAKIFASLGNFKNSSAQAIECRCSADYNKAVALMTQGDYDGAAALLSYAASVRYKDAKDLLAECKSRDTYYEAVAAFNSKKFFTAYKLFKSVSDYKDAADYAGRCIQSKPSTGETYRNGSYYSAQNKLTIIAKYSGCTYIKIYSGTTLVSTIFFNGAKTVSITLPNGSYKIKAALGDTWFGSEEMFGDKGTYMVLTFNGGAETYNFTGGEYQLTLGGVANGNVGSSGQNWNNF